MSIAQEIYDKNKTYETVIVAASSNCIDVISFDNGWSKDYVFSDGSAIEQRDQSLASCESSCVRVKV